MMSKLFYLDMRVIIFIYWSPQVSHTHICTHPPTHMWVYKLLFHEIHAAPNEGTADNRLIKLQDLRLALK